MRKLDQRDGRQVMESVLGSLVMLTFALGVLAFLIAVDHADWFHIRPATGTAAAMSNAADRPLHRDHSDQL